MFLAIGELFQDNQKDLETATETLSEYLEREISAENVVDIKQKVQDKYRWATIVYHLLTAAAVFSSSSFFRFIKYIHRNVYFINGSIVKRTLSQYCVTDIATAGGRYWWTTCSRATKTIGGLILKKIVDEVRTRRQRGSGHLLHRHHSSDTLPTSLPSSMLSSFLVAYRFPLAERVFVGLVDL